MTLHEAPAASDAAGTDRVLTTLLQRRLEAISDEIATTLLRTTRSALLSQAGDLGAAVLGPRGELLAGTEYVPVLAFSLRQTCRAVVDYFGGDIQPGDVVLHNDVFSGSPQSSDVGVLMPVFAGERLVAWVAARGHQLDIGGAVPGGCNPLATEVWQEALRIPPVKVVDAGRPRRDVWDLVFANVRAREIVEADMRAQIGACRIGVRELERLVERYGPDVFAAQSEALLEATEAMMRAAVASFPDGTYEGSSLVNTDMWGELEQHQIRVTIRIAGDRITVDFTGTASQTRGYANAPLASSASATLRALVTLVAGRIPRNDGLMRPVELVIPHGCMLNPAFPAATFYGNFMSMHTYEAIMGALQHALPESACAGWNRAYDVRTAGRDPVTGRSYGDIHFLGLKGGTGAVSGADGYSQGAPVFAPGLRTQDYEINEVQYPHFILEHEYLTDSAGAGRWRGGLGVTYRCRLDAEDGTAVTQGDGLLEGAAGMHGGRSGVRNLIELVTPDGGARALRAMEVVHDVVPGTVIRQRAGGGGGYGDPLERPVEQVLADVDNGVVSIAAAAADYGVAVTLDELGVPKVDHAATAQRRGASRASGGAGVA